MKDDINKEKPKASKKNPKEKSVKRKGSKSFNPIFNNVAGIDIGSELIHVAILHDNDEYEIREFGTMTPDLHEIAKWLIQNKIESAAMEATGIYWVPLYETLEEYHLKPALVDPSKVKNVPGRKTDFLDAEWIQKLYSCGLLRSAFRPAKDKEAFRSYMRHRSNIVKARQRAILHMDKSLLLMNVKLDVAVSELVGLSGMKIIRAIVDGERDPEKLAALRHRSCKKPEAVFIAALTGNYQDTHIFSLEQSLETYDFLGKQLNECDKKILAELDKWETIKEGPLPPREKDKRSRKNRYSNSRKANHNDFNFDIQTKLYQKAGVDLSAINSIGPTNFAIIISELGGKEGIESFKTEKEWASWLALCPGNNVSGGKRLGGKARKSKNKIKAALMQAALALTHSKCALGAYYRRLASRTGKSTAMKAVAHKLARMIYHLLKHGVAYVEEGQKEYEERYKKKQLKNLQKNAKDLGYKLEKAA
jgi:transposase